MKRRRSDKTVRDTASEVSALRRAVGSTFGFLLGSGFFVLAFLAPNGALFLASYFAGVIVVNAWAWRGDRRGFNRGLRAGWDDCRAAQRDGADRVKHEIDNRIAGAKGHN